MAGKHGRHRNWKRVIVCVICIGGLASCDGQAAGVRQASSLAGDVANSDDFSIAEETLHQAKYAGVDYESLLALAREGDRESLQKLMRFTRKTDAAGALGHGVILSQLLDAVGDQAFAGVLETETDDVRWEVNHILDAESYRRDRATLIFWRERAPLTAAAMWGDSEPTSLDGDSSNPPPAAVGSLPR